MPDNMSRERRAAMRAYGAEPILVTKEQESKARFSARYVRIGKTARSASSTPITHMRIHTTTGLGNLAAQTSGRITHFVSSMGTTGNSLPAVAFFCAWL